MDWVEVKTTSAGTKMLYPMAWSILPIVAGILVMLKLDTIYSSILLAFGMFLSMIAVWLGTTVVPGRVDMLVLLVTPIFALSLLFQPPELVQVTACIGVWIWNYRTASFLSIISSKAYRCEWDQNRDLPEINGARYFQKKWAERPLFRVGKNIIRGIKHEGKFMLEADSPIDFMDIPHTLELD